MKRIILSLLIVCLISGCQTKKEVKPETGKVSCTFVGDMLYEQPYYDWIEDDSLDKGYYDLIMPYLKNDNLSIANLEVPIAGVGYSFNSSYEIGNQVANLGLEVVSTANNHANDRGNQGINNTLDFLNKNNILPVGTYYDQEDRNQRKYKTINGIKFGFVSYTYATNQMINENDKYKVGLFNEPSTRQMTQEYKHTLTKEVSETRKNCDVLIVMMHWGTEFTYQINSQQKEISKTLSNLGTDIIIGNHPHCAQPIEWINNKTLCMYSLGNFISADPIVKRTNKEFRNAYNVSLMLNLNINKTDKKISITDMTYTPIINYYDQKLQNFKLIPFEQYTDELEKTHYHYKNGFNKQWIKNTYETLVDI